MEHLRRVLIAEDDASVRKNLHELLVRWGFVVAEACDGARAEQMLSDDQPTILLVDLKMPRRDGLSLLELVRERRLPIASLVISGEGGIKDAVRAMQLGAEDYLEKPIEPSHLRVLLNRICERLEDGGTDSERWAEQRLIARSPAMRAVMDTVVLVAPTNSGVVLEGESGTGKELVARTIHRASMRAQGPYVAINCAALPDTLVESELFGHERGAFTGARETRRGCFELAQGGTLLLDEIGEMKPQLQSKLLRVLEEGSLRRVGGQSEVPVDVRLLTATNTNLDEALAQGRLRADLYYRLGVFRIRLPPLRERREDIAELAGSFITHFARDSHKAVRGLTDDCLRVLQSYSWPGNVRQLRNVIERAVAVTTGELLNRAELPAELRQQAAVTPSFEVHVGDTVEQVERELITRTLTMFDGNKTRAAQALGISLRTLYNRLARYEQGSGLKSNLN